MDRVSDEDFTHKRDSNLGTHDIVISAMSPSWCRKCNLSGRELGLKPCIKSADPKQTKGKED